MVLPALVSRRALDNAKRWGVRCGMSGSSQRDRLGVEGSLARWLRRGRPCCEGVFDGAKRERVGRGGMLVSGCAFDGAKRERVGGAEAAGLREAYGIARSGGLVELPQTEAAGPRNPRCASTGGGGDCGGRARVRVGRGCARVSGRLSNGSDRGCVDGCRLECGNALGQARWATDSGIHRTRNPAPPAPRC